LVFHSSDVLSVFVGIRSFFGFIGVIRTRATFTRVIGIRIYFRIVSSRGPCIWVSADSLVLLVVFFSLFSIIIVVRYLFGHLSDHVTERIAHTISVIIVVIIGVIGITSWTIASVTAITPIWTAIRVNSTTIRTWSIRIYSIRISWSETTITANWVVVWMVVGVSWLVSLRYVIVVESHFGFSLSNALISFIFLLSSNAHNSGLCSLIVCFLVYSILLLL